MASLLYIHCKYMGFSTKTKEDVMVACGRHCAICHKFCGLKIEIHHIVERADGGDDSFDNAIPLCFDCHADMRSYDHQHPKGTKYTRAEEKRHRDAWYAKVAGNIGLINKQEVVDTDKLVYRRLVSILPWEGAISFIERNNFAGFSFDRDRLRQLDAFELECENPAFEFVDPDLEGLRATLAEGVKAFTLVIANETFSTGIDYLRTVPSDWEFSDPERFEQVVKEIHDGARRIVETYRQLIRMATRKLGVLPPKFANDGAS